MARRGGKQRIDLGYFTGKDPAGADVLLSAYRLGTSSYLVNAAGRKHLVHPSKDGQGINGLRTEAVIVFNLTDVKHHMSLPQPSPELSAKEDT